MEPSPSEQNQMNCTRTRANTQSRRHNICTDTHYIRTPLPRLLSGNFPHHSAHARAVWQNPWRMINAYLVHRPLYRRTRGTRISRFLCLHMCIAGLGGALFCCDFCCDVRYFPSTDTPLHTRRDENVVYGITRWKKGKMLIKFAFHTDES